MEGGFRGEVQVLRHQLDCYKAAAKQLGVLLMHRNKEIAGALPIQSSQKGLAWSFGSGTPTSILGLAISTHRLSQCGGLYAVLLQEMQLDTSSSVTRTQAGGLIPAVWGKATPEAVQMYEPDDYMMYQNIVDQV